MRKLSYCILIASVLGSCAPVQDAIVTLDSSNVREYAGKSFFGDFIEDWDFVKFETSESSFIAEVINTEFCDGKIFVATRPPLGGYWAANQLKVFSDSGEYLYDIGRQGRGPGEFINIQTFRLNGRNKQVVIRDQNHHVFKYDFNGRFIEQIELESSELRYPYTFFFLPDGDILLYNHLLPKANKSTYTVVDERFKTIAELDTIIYKVRNPQGYSTSTIERSPVAIEGNSVVMLKDLCDTVFVYSEGVLTPVCNLASYGTMPKGVKKEDVIIDPGKIVELMTPEIVKAIYMTPDVVLICKEDNFLVLNRDLDKGFHIGVLPREVSSVPVGKSPPESVYRVDGVRDGRLYAWIQAIDLIEYKEQCEETGMELSEKQKALFHGLKEDDNPVLVFYKMKEMTL
jgi:hypothetical protein